MITSKETNITHKLTTYQAAAEAELERILDFWQHNALDKKYGGFIGRMKYNGEVVEDAPKGGVLNTRILWTFSAAYRHTQNKAHLSIADRAYAYLLDYFWDDEFKGIYWEVDAQGNPLNTRKQVYALAFALYGFSEYFMATKTPKALQLCQEIFKWIEKYSYDPKYGGYLESFSREGALLDDLRLSEKNRNDPKTMNTHLHVLEAYANLYRIWPDQHLAQQLEKLLTVFLQHIVNPETGHMQLFFTRNWTSTADLVSYGHDIEASWLLLEATEVLGKEELVEQVKTMAISMARATAEALQPDGSLYHEYNRESNHYDTHREWWVSAEAMVGFLNAYQLTHRESFLENSLSAWQFAQNHLLDKANGEWIWGVYDDYSPMTSEDKIGFWKCPYHNARACLEVVQRCREQIKF